MRSEGLSILLEFTPSRMLRLWLLPGTYRCSGAGPYDMSGVGVEHTDLTNAHLVFTASWPMLRREWAESLQSRRLGFNGIDTTDNSVFFQGEAIA